PRAGGTDSPMARMQAFIQAEFADALARIEARLNDELLPSRDPDVASPFGAEVAAAFPSLAYDIEEAAHCLASRRPTAAVFHCAQVLRHGIQSLLHRRGVGDASVPVGQ